MSKIFIKIIFIFSKYFFVLLMVFFTFEVSARLDDYIRYKAPLLSKYSSDRLRGVSDGHQYNIPNARFEKWKNNNLGFRGPDLDIRKKDNITRIVVIGSSESYGLYESENNEWPAQLRNLLPDSHYEVINSSVAGLGLHRYKHYFDSHVSLLNPDIVILFINPYFVACSENYRAIEGNNNIDSDKVDSLEIILNNLTVRQDGFQLRVLAKIKSSMKETISYYAPKLLEYYQYENLKKQILSLENSRLEGASPLSNVDDERLDRYFDDLQDIVDHIKSNNIDIILATYPTLISSTNMNNYPALFSDFRRFCIRYTISGIADISKKYAEKNIEIANIKKVKMIDLYSTLPRKIENFGDNVHFTDKGSKLIAENIYESIIDVSK